MEAEVTAVQREVRTRVLRLFARLGVARTRKSYFDGSVKEDGESLRHSGLSGKYARSVLLSQEREPCRQRRR